MKTLFLISGLGLGNSTRCHAIIQCLKDAGTRNFVATSENGLWYFAGQPEVERSFELESLYYGKNQGRISIAATIASSFDFIGIQRRNEARVERLLETLRPDVVVTDSVYISKPMHRRKIPLVALNNADAVVRGYRKFRNRPAEIRAQFYAMELMDYLYHAWRPDLVISPVLLAELGRSRGKFHAVGAIVRKGYQPTPYRERAQNAVIMLSGSAFGTEIRLSRAGYPVRIDVLGRSAPPGWNGIAGVTYHGRVRDPRPFLQAADLVVVNGGFSAVSEMIGMAKPMIVVPVPGHAEQWVNGQVVDYLGIGMVAKEDEIEDKILTAARCLPRLQAAYAKRPLRADGAREAASLILGAVKRD